MYSIEEYGRMVGDKVRCGAYARAIERAVGPGSTVLDIGTGTGLFSLLACRSGARKVYAVEESDAIAVAQRIALANGFGDRIEFIQGLSTEITLPERVDVVVADLHGKLPLFKANVVSMVDARRRLLREGGVMIPRQDTLWAAVVDAAREHDRIVSPWARENYGLDMDAALEATTNCLTSVAVERDQLRSEPQRWGVLDYATIEEPGHCASLAFCVTKAGIAHGLLLWFDTILVDGIGLSNAPGEPALVYGSMFLPWPRAVSLEIGEAVTVRLRADYIGANYLWSWESSVLQGTPARTKLHFRQSTFWGSPPSPMRLHRRRNDHRPVLGASGRADAFILGRMDGATPLEDIARAAFERFPDRFRTFGEALSRAGDLSETYDGGREAPGAIPKR